ncbi:MAG: PTS sugar transporter subunit IIB [Firmicutes bacterium]|nr:PTS sugar transporter subunit IIB [Bacillota bacterium]MCL5039729.1 PTS sugar transporter subunit IIB [Bacillota bacterium]
MRYKILVVCGSGLGSSLIVEMNIQEVIKELGLPAEVSHADLASARGAKTDIIVGTRDLAPQLADKAPEVITLNSLFDKKEVREKLKELFARLAPKN